MRKHLAVWALAVLLLGGAGALHLRADAPGDNAANKPLTEEDKAAAREEEKYQKFIGFLFDEYARIGQSKDWLTRGLTTISTARLPQSRAVKTLLTILKDDPDPVVSLVAWECILARSKTVDPEQFEVWLSLTPGLVNRNVFNGRLRVELLQFLSLSPPDAAAKKIFWKVFDETNSLIPNDIPVIEELGKLLAVWRSPDLVKGLLERLIVFNDSYRAELVLHSAGCSVAWAGNRCDQMSGAMWEAAVKDYAEWWKTDKANWKETTAAPEGTPWRNLTAKYLALDMFDRDAIKDNAPEVRRDLELGTPGLRTFDVMFVLDATESMQPPMDWIKGDLRKMMLVMGRMSSKPRIGITFYRDYYAWPRHDGPGPYGFVAKTAPLTTNIDSLIKALAMTPAFGGGDDPEAVKEGLEDCVKHGGWDLGKHAGIVDYTATPEEKAAASQAATRTANPGDPAIDPKVMILIGDAPPHPGTEADCLAIAKTAAGFGFKIYAVKLTTPLGEDKGHLPSFDQIAAAGNGVSLAADFTGTNSNFEFRGTAPHRAANVRHVWLAKSNVKGSPSQELLTRILLDAVNVKYKERIEMIVPLMLEVCELPTPEVRQPFNAAPEPVKSPAPKTPPTKPHQF